MVNGFDLTVRKALSRETFKNANVLAGVKGLDQNVKWTHILETREFESLLNGGELILTTGVGLHLDSRDFYERLIRKGISGICIEKGSYFNDITPEIKQLADESNLPIIIFEKIVRFVDITQDLHTLIINQHHQMLSQLNQMTKKFTELSLSPNGILKILQELHNYFGTNNLFIAEDVKSYYYPPECKHLEERLRLHVNDLDFVDHHHTVLSINEGKFALCPVRGLGQIWGYLFLQVNDRQTDEFFYSVLDTAALAVAQIMLRNRTIEERKLNQEDKLVRGLLQGKNYDLDDLQTLLPFSGKDQYFRVFLIQTNSPDFNIREDDWEELKLQRSMIIRSLIKQAGLIPAVSVKKHEIAIICFFSASKEKKKNTKQFLQIIHGIFNMNEQRIIDGSMCMVGVSNVCNDLLHTSRSYVEAKDVLYLQQSKILQSYFYENIGVYKLLMDLQKRNLLEAYIYDYLGPIFRHDQEMGGDLLTTLAIYLECGFSKKEAADRLFIVRQTLYHRLEKIKQLLGNNIMEPANRLAIEVAIKAYYLLEDHQKLELEKIY